MMNYILENLLSEKKWGLQHIYIMSSQRIEIVQFPEPKVQRCDRQLVSAS